MKSALREAKKGKSIIITKNKSKWVESTFMHVNGTTRWIDTYTMIKRAIVTPLKQDYFIYV